MIKTKSLTIYLLLTFQMASCKTATISYDYNSINQLNEFIKKSSKKENTTYHILNSVNKRINKIPWKSDIDLWGKKDYWASLEEFIRAEGGDCEDYAIAKLVILIRLGIPREKLRLIYGFSEDNEAHMVLSYYKNEDSDPLILDNLSLEIKPLSKINNFRPLYSFNYDLDLWIFKNEKAIKTDNKINHPTFLRSISKNKQYLIDRR